MSTQTLADNLIRAAGEFCQEHQITDPTTGRKIVEAMHVAAMQTMHWQNERHLRDSIALHEAAEQTAWQEIVDRQSMEARP